MGTECSSRTLKRVTLKMGGKGAATGLGDACVEEVAPKIAQLAWVNSGQVAHPICRDLRALLTLDRILDGLLNDIKPNDLNVIVGGFLFNFKSVSENGYFVTPTVVDNLPDDSHIMTEERFGPLLPSVK
ncbi:Aldehyde dehydrogenase [Fusarium sp. LHS14.1]|nr:Aldehyde dehydrogenase [Fusarium sp. LHS14.1]